MVRDLSGGEKGRLALAKLIYSQKNVLVLDEPTNHLDIPAREALEAALDEYPGTILTVSHDRFFLDKIATQILAFDPDGNVVHYNGNYTEYHDWREKQESIAGKGSTARVIEPPLSVPTASDAGKGSLSKNQRSQLEKRIKEIESEIPLLETKAAELNEEIAKPAIASDYGRLGELTKELTDAESQIKLLYSEWESAANELG